MSKDREDADALRRTVERLMARSQRLKQARDAARQERDTTAARWRDWSGFWLLKLRDLVNRHGDDAIRDALTDVLRGLECDDGAGPEQAEEADRIRALDLPRMPPPFDGESDR